MLVLCSENEGGSTNTAGIGKNFSMLFVLIGIFFLYLVFQ